MAAKSTRFYARGIAGRDRHYWRAGGSAVAGGAGRAGSRPADEVHQQHEAMGPGDAHASRRLWQAPVCQTEQSPHRLGHETLALRRAAEPLQPLQLQHGYFHMLPNCVANTFDGLIAQKVSIYICPSDRNVSPYPSGRSVLAGQGQLRRQLGAVHRSASERLPRCRRHLAPFGSDKFHQRGRIDELPAGNAARRNHRWHFEHAADVGSHHPSATPNSATAAAISTTTAPAARSFRRSTRPIPASIPSSTPSPARTTCPGCPVRRPPTGTLPPAAGIPAESWLRIATAPCALCPNSVALGVWRSVSTMNEGVPASLD